MEAGEKDSSTGPLKLKTFLEGGGDQRRIRADTNGFSLQKIPLHKILRQFSVRGKLLRRYERTGVPHI